LKTKAVIFDYDGVIISSLDLYHDAYLEVAKHFPHEYFKDFKGNIENHDIDWKAQMRRIGITDLKDHTKIKEIFTDYCNKHLNRITIIPGIKEVLTSLKQEYLLAVASNNYEKIIKQTFYKFDILKYFNVIAGGEKEVLKPDPTVILHCVKALGVKPEECVYIGDMDGDIIAGRAAGVKKVIAVTFGFHSYAKLKKLNPDEIIHKPEELLEVVG